MENVPERRVHAAGHRCRIHPSPRLRLVADGLSDRFRSLWPEAVVPAFPALAGPRSTLARPLGDGSRVSDPGRTVSGLAVRAGRMAD